MGKDKLVGRQWAEATVTITNQLDPLWQTWRKSRHLFNQCPLFVMPPWLDAWHNTLGRDAALSLLIAHGSGGVEGYAALKVSRGVGFFAGDPEVCDYFDVVSMRGREDVVCRSLLQAAPREVLRVLDLFPVRPSSAVMTHVVPLCRALGYALSVERTDVTVEMPLDGSWEGYLRSLNGKQRHEVRRKMRRLEEAGSVDFRVITSADALEPALHVFFDLFQRNREDKAEFLTPSVRAYLETLCRNMAREGMLRLSVLYLNKSPVASALCFDDAQALFLYNNGYDAAFAALSVGLMHTVFTIKDAVELGRTRYEFLRGDENYKIRLGGQEVPLYRVRISLKTP